MILFLTDYLKEYLLSFDECNYFQTKLPPAESSFNIFKNQFAKNRIFIAVADLLNCLEEFKHYNNQIRYPKTLYGLHPLQVLNGEAINKKRFAPYLKIAKDTRYQNNTSMNGCNICK